ncbi:MAG: hypothetical protein MZV49_00070 [Rhodopseudomonas palustris]|nr:hypothetical protein [Rhodopseudomonas palustris]
MRLAIHNHGPGDLRYPTPGSVLERDRTPRSPDRRLPRRRTLPALRHRSRRRRPRACGPRILDVHLKDVTGRDAEGGRRRRGRPRRHRPPPPAPTPLADIGFRGTAAFEYEKDGRDPLAGLAESVGYVRGVLAGAGRGPRASRSSDEP